MVTAAEGAEEFYNFSNEARYESVQEARIRDHSLRLAYLGHSNYKIVDNSSKDFEHKVKKTIGMVNSVLGLPTDVSVFKKYLVSGNIDPIQSNVNFPKDIPVEKMSLLETFLPKPKSDSEIDQTGVQVSVRKRDENGLSLFTYEKRFTIGEQRI